jgi:alkylation response protein AidB-like acyl-CoA dehydrogenase
MDFSLTEEQKILRKMFREFVANEVAPLAEETDHEEKPPLNVLRKAAEQGFLGAIIPEDYGGASLDIISYCILLEEIAKACMSTAVTISAHNGLASKTILDYGTEEQKRRFLEPMAEGSTIGAFAITEPAAGSDIEALETKALREGSDYILSGSKVWVSNGSIAGVFIVFARTENGIGAFIVERGTPGFKVGRREKTLGLRGLTMTPLYFDDCRLSSFNLLSGEGMEIATSAMDFSRLSLAAICLGGAEAALDAGIGFAAEREQFGGPIALKQAIQNFVADTAAEIEALRYTVYHAAWLAERKEPYAQEAAIAKLFGSQVAMRAANKMLQVHGGYGYMKEYAIERMYRDFRALEIIGGTSEIQRVFIAANIFAEKGVMIRP